MADLASYARQPITSRLRIQSLELLRGALMVIMAIDHTRDFFHGYSQRLSPEDLDHTDLAIFLTRWITLVFLQVADGRTILLVYPLVPWIGVMAAGYCLGRLWDLNDHDRQRILWRLGWAMTTAFVLLRLTNLDGDPQPGPASPRRHSP